MKICPLCVPPRPGVVKALEEFKNSVYGENYNEDDEDHGKASDASKKRKAIAQNAVKESANYDWADLADNGKVLYNALVTCLICSNSVLKCCLK